jgi:hypothetical protein
MPTHANGASIITIKHAEMFLFLWYTYTKLIYYYLRTIIYVFNISSYEGRKLRIRTKVENKSHEISASKHKQRSEMKMAPAEKFLPKSDNLLLDR